MAADGGKVVIKIDGDTQGFDKAISNVGNVAKTGLKYAVTSIVAVGTALAGAGAYATNLASNLQEVQNVVDVTFGSNANKVNDWAKNAGSAFGLAELQAKQYSGTLGAMIKSSGLSETATVEMSTALAGLTGDFASFYNLDHQTAFDKIRAGISGETEPLRQLGINMSVANLEAYALSAGIKKSYDEMTEAEKVTLRYNYLMKQSADAQGDFARTSDSFANQLRIIRTNLDVLASGVGKVLLPSMTAATNGVNEYISRLQSAFDADGMDGLVKEAGSVFADITAEIANQAPAMIDTAVYFINSFINALSDNADLIGAGGAKIVVALAKGVIDMTPAIINAAKEIAVAFVREIGNQVPLLKPFASIIETIVDNLDVLLPTVVAVVVAVKALSVMQKVTGYFNIAGKAVDKYIEACAQYIAATSAGIVVQGGFTSSLTISQLAIGVYQKKITLATAATALWNKVLALNPYTMLIIGIVGVTTAAIALTSALDDSKEVHEATMEALEKESQAVEDAKNSYNDLKQAQIDQAGVELAEIANTEKLVAELKLLADENGKVTGANQKRADYILNELNEAYGTEYKMTDGIIGKYGELINTIDDLIEKRKLEVLEKAATANYNEAYNKHVEQALKVEEAKKKVEETRRELDALLAQDAIGRSGSRKDIEQLQEQLAEEERILNESYGLREQFYSDIQSMEAFDVAVSNGNYEEAMRVLSEYSSTYANELGKLRGSLEEQTAYAAGKGNELLSIMADYRARAAAEGRDHNDSIYQGMVANYNALVAESDKYGINLMESMGLTYEQLSQLAADSNTSIQELTGINNEELLAKAKEYGLTLEQINALTWNDIQAIISGQYQATKNSSSHAASGAVDGVGSQNTNMYNAGKTLGAKTSDGFNETASYEDGKASGRNYGLGVAAGLLNTAVNEVANAAKKIAINTDGVVQKELDINSPSKKAIKTMEWYGKGGVIGLKNTEVLMAEEAKKIGTVTHSAFQQALIQGQNLSQQLLTSIFGGFGSQQSHNVVNNNQKEINVTQEFNSPTVSAFDSFKQLLGWV